MQREHGSGVRTLGGGGIRSFQDFLCSFRTNAVTPGLDRLFALLEQILDSRLRQSRGFRIDRSG
jgi:hypothetical protein